MTADTPSREYSPADIKRYLANHKDEVDGVALYRLLESAAGERERQLDERNFKKH